MRTGVATLLTLAVVVAGCLDVDDPDRSSPPGDDGAEAPSADAEWPALEDAPLRPGVQIVSPTGQCTSNFVFVDDASVYFGLAAHCVEGMQLGEGVQIDGTRATGTLAYSSWLTMAEVEETDASALEYNDFALVRVDNDYRALVHPAMRHFGGPVSLASSSDVATGDKVLTYGNSGIRQQVDPLSWHEGAVVARPDPWTTTVLTATPGIPGDSGSGALTADGRALGVVVTLTVAPLAGTNGVTSLDLALDYAREKAGVDVQLATWELLDAGLVPT